MFASFVRRGKAVLVKKVRQKVPILPHRAFIRKKFVSFAVIVLMAGCASVDPAPFNQFASSLQPLRAGIDAEAKLAAEASRQALIQKVNNGEVSPADLQLQFDSDNPFAATYGFVETRPNFIKLKRFRRGLASLNEAMVAYAQTLVILAGGSQNGDSLPTTAQFDQMARDLNANTGNAASALGLRLDPDEQAFLSAGAIRLFKAYIDTKRYSALANALSKVQPRVVEFSDTAQQAVRLLASLVTTEYNSKVLSLAVASPPDAAPILALNDSTQVTLATLGSLYNNYAALPAAHNDLIAVASTKSTGLTGIIALGTEAKRLQGLVEELSKANEAAASRN